MWRYAVKDKKTQLTNDGRTFDSQKYHQRVPRNRKGRQAFDRIVQDQIDDRGQDVRREDVLSILCSKNYLIAQKA